MEKRKRIEDEVYDISEYVGQPHRFDRIKHLRAEKKKVADLLKLKEKKEEK